MPWHSWQVTSSRWVLCHVYTWTYELNIAEFGKSQRLDWYRLSVVFCSGNTKPFEVPKFTSCELYATTWIYTTLSPATGKAKQSGLLMTSRRNDQQISVVGYWEDTLRVDQNYSSGWKDCHAPSDLHIQTFLYTDMRRWKDPILVRTPFIGDNCQCSHSNRATLH